MSKKILIIRHATAEDYASTGQDFDRELTTKGIKQSEEMSKVLRDLNISPQKIYTSPAPRAKNTAQIFAKNLGYSHENIIENQDAYEASVEHLLEIVDNFDEQADTVALFGHNPGLAYLAGYLGSQAISSLPKAGIILITFSNLSWKGLKPKDGKTEWVKSPKFNLDI